MDSDGKDSNNIRQHVVLADVVGESQVDEAGGLDLAPVGPRGPITHEIYAELALGSLNSSVGGAGGDREALREELEVVNERLHGGLHLSPAGGHALGVVCPHVTSRHLIETLLDDAETLPHLRHPHEVPGAERILSRRNLSLDNLKSYYHQG